ncbi:MAG: peptidylprolyl isomerase [Oscillospiraceae bacterium]|nr:peptidylprolyl isomerase [Oscillospiraceae bacterium]
MKKLAEKHAAPSEMEHLKSGKPMFSLIKILSLILCMALIFASLAACDDGADIESNGDEDVPSEVVDSDDDPSADADGFVTNHSERVAANLEEAMTTFDRDAIMISAGDDHITWAELYSHIYSTISNFTGFFQNPVDWSEIVHGDETLAVMALELATESAMTLLLYRHGASTLNIAIAEDELDRLNEEMQIVFDHYGSFENFTQALRIEYGFYDFETFERVITTERLVTPILNTLYGEFGVDLSDEIAEEFATREGFMMARHILIMSTEDNSAREAIDEIYERLLPRAQDDDFVDFFTELMLQYSEDPGSLTNPGGYLFQPWDMVEPFSSAALELTYGEMSEIVETSHGYHIILRLPVDLDAVPISIISQGMAHTLRQVAASDNFPTVMQQWREEMNPVFSELYQSIDLARIFAWLEE